MKMTTVLLIWEETPEPCRIYKIDVNPEEMYVLILAHGKYVNSDDLNDEENKAFDYIQMAICVPKHHHYHPDYDKKILGKWSGCELPIEKNGSPLMNMEGVELLAICGFIC